MCLTESTATFRTEQTQREREREREVCARWERERPRIFRCIIFIFATSRIHKKHVQLGHADVVVAINTVNSNRSRVRGRA